MIDEDNQRDFTSQSEQLAYFTSKSVFTFSRVTYVKTTDFLTGEIKLPVGYVQSLKCDYLFFNNADSDGQSKYFYARITGREYIDTATTSFRFELDCYQTFLFDHTIKSSLIERNHSPVTDKRITLDLIAPDNGKIPLGTKVALKTIKIANPKENGELIIMLYMKPKTPLAEATNWLMPIVNSIPYSGDIYAIPYTVEGLGTLRNIILNYVLKDGVSLGTVQWEIDGIYIVPNIDNMLRVQFGDTGYYKFDGDYDQLFNFTLTKVEVDLQQFDLFTDEKKLNFQPYTQFSIMTSGGQSIDEIDLMGCGQYEARNQMLIYFGLEFQPFPKFNMWIGDYEGAQPISENSGGLNPKHQISIDLPQIYFNMISGLGETIKNGLLQLVQFSNISERGFTLSEEKNFSKIKSDSERNLAKAELSNQIKEETDMKKSDVFFNYTPSFQLNRTGGVAGQQFVTGLTCGIFAIYLTHYQTTMRLSIYDYFKRYGYQLNQYGVPNLRSRSLWNYVKTKDCVVTGNLPLNAKQKIQDMFDRGVTLWHTNDILDYQGVNS